MAQQQQLLYLQQVYQSQHEEGDAGVGTGGMGETEGDESETAGMAQHMDTDMEQQHPGSEHHQLQQQRGSDGFLPPRAFGSHHMPPRGYSAPPASSAAGSLGLSQGNQSGSATALLPENGPFSTPQLQRMRSTSYSNSGEHERDSGTCRRH